MSLDRIVNLTINLAESPIALADFSTPLVAAILTSPQGTAWDDEYDAAQDVITVTPATWQAVMTALGVSSSEDLYVCLSDLFAQSRKPPRARIGRRATAVAQVVRVDIAATTNGDFTVTINGVDFTFAASSSTATQIRDGLISAINGGTEPVTAAIVDADSLSLTADLAGAPFTHDVEHSSNPAAITATQTTASIGLPEDIANWRSQTAFDGDSWYCLLETTRLDGNIRAAAETIEALGARKIFIAQTDDANALTGATTDIGYVLGPLGLNLLRTSVWYHDDDNEFVDAAIAGLMLPAQPGSETWANKTLRSVTGLQPGAGETNLATKNYSWFEAFPAGNFSMTQEGAVASGQWLDIVTGADWLHNLMQIDLVSLLRDSPRLPYTDEGRQQIDGTIRAALLKAAARTINFVDAATIETDVPRASAQSDTDRGNRHFPNANWSATLTGAVHTIASTGSLAP